MSRKTNLIKASSIVCSFVASIGIFITIILIINYYFGEVIALIVLGSSLILASIVVCIYFIYYILMKFENYDTEE